MAAQFYEEFVDEPGPEDRPPQDLPTRTVFSLRGGTELRTAAERILAATHPLAGLTSVPPLETAFLVHAWEILSLAAAEVLHEKDASNPPKGFLTIQNWSLGDEDKKQPRVRFDAGLTALPQFLGFPFVVEHCLPRHLVRGILDSEIQRHLGFGIETGLLLFVSRELTGLPVNLQNRLTEVSSPTGDAWILGNLLEGCERPELQVYAPTQANYPPKPPATWAPSG